MFTDLIKSEIRKRNISTRAAAREIGVAHTTLFRILDGKKADVPTIEKIALWLGVNPSSLVDLSQPFPNEGITKVAAFFSVNPALVHTLSTTIDQIHDNTLDMTVIKDVLDYLAYLIQKRSPG